MSFPHTATTRQDGGRSRLLPSSAPEATNLLSVLTDIPLLDSHANVLQPTASRARLSHGAPCAPGSPDAACAGLVTGERRPAGRADHLCLPTAFGLLPLWGAYDLRYYEHSRADFCSDARFQFARTVPERGSDDLCSSVLGISKDRRAVVHGGWEPARPPQRRWRQMGTRSTQTDTHATLTTNHAFLLLAPAARAPCGAVLWSASPPLTASDAERLFVSSLAISASSFLDSLFCEFLKGLMCLSTIRF